MSRQGVVYIHKSHNLQNSGLITELRTKIIFRDTHEISNKRLPVADKKFKVNNCIEFERSFLFYFVHRSTNKWSVQIDNYVKTDKRKSWTNDALPTVKQSLGVSLFTVNCCGKILILKLSK